MRVYIYMYVRSRYKNPRIDFGDDVSFINYWWWTMLASEANQSFPLGAFIIDRRETAKEDPLKVKTSREDNHLPNALPPVNISLRVYDISCSRITPRISPSENNTLHTNARARTHTTHPHSRAHTSAHTNKLVHICWKVSCSWHASCL